MYNDKGIYGAGGGGSAQGIKIVPTLLHIVQVD